ncbi:MAG: DNA internalization-related competence protein ComEC/Rec2 [Bacilli bacterium]|nr:DNA internalization-related competence protein ComEC/Rec2 [Bacilli bacterium]
MKKLKIILQYNWIFYIIFFFSLLYCFLYINIPKESKYDEDDIIFNCIIDDMFIDGNYLNIRLIGKEKIQASYYFKSLKEKENFTNEYSLGDQVIVKGELKAPNDNTNFNVFNYKKYLYYENIFYILDINEINKTNDNSNFLYGLKNFIITRLEKLKSSSYLYALILGDDRYIDDNMISNYQSIGISHLFAISGMHVSILSGILLFLFKKIHMNEKFAYFIITLFLFCYLFITGCSPSILRAVVLFLLLTINRLLKLNLKTLNVYLLTISIIICLDPFIIFKVGFQFSAIVSGALILFNNLIDNKGNYFMKLLMTSFIAFLMGIPISIYNFNQINILSFIYNLFFVPLISFLLFPLTLITFLFPIFDSVLSTIINILEFMTNICVKLPGTLILKRTSFIVVLIYYLFILLVLIKWKKNKINMLLFCFILLVHHNYHYIFKERFVLFLDVGQGDSALIYDSGQSILIDTGGKINYEQEKWQYRLHRGSLSNSTVIPSIKSLGIKKLDYLIITHGDYDHMGESINLVNNFKVEKVIFNCGQFNDLEKELIKILDKKKIPYYSCADELNIEDSKLYFLNSKDYGNENDNSSIIYTELNNYKFLFMGDAGVEVEGDLIKKYNLQDIDVLKVGHHGSKTSSSKTFIDEINPKYSIISVGKNNRYGHPNDSVLENLEDSKIYRTDNDGSIMFKIKNNKMNIETCAS